MFSSHFSMDGSGTTGPLLNHISVNVHGLIYQSTPSINILSTAIWCPALTISVWTEKHSDEEDFTSLPIWYSLIPLDRSLIHPNRPYLKGSITFYIQFNELQIFFLYPKRIHQCYEFDYEGPYPTITETFKPL